MDEDEKDLRLDDELDEPTLDEMGEEGEEDFNIDLEFVQQKIHYI